MVWAPRTSASYRTSSAVRGWIIARSPRRARSRSRSASPSGSVLPRAPQRIGDLKIKISGCINACGHHHVGHIGILGLEKAGVESYQLTLGGSADETCAIGDITGARFLLGQDRRRGRDRGGYVSQAAHRHGRKFPDRVPARGHEALQGGAVCWRLMSAGLRRTSQTRRGAVPPSRAPCPIATRTRRHRPACRRRSAISSRTASRWCRASARTRRSCCT